MLFGALIVNARILSKDAPLKGSAFFARNAPQRYILGICFHLLMAGNLIVVNCAAQKSSWSLLKSGRLPFPYLPPRL
jgi:hypothetical protein